MYENDHWGTIHVELKGDRLATAIGDLPVPLKSTGSDRMQLGIDPRMWRDARFEVKEGRVAAVVVLWNDHGEARFTRKKR